MATVSSGHVAAADHAPIIVAVDAARTAARSLAVVAVGRCRTRRDGDRRLADFVTARHRPHRRADPRPVRRRIRCPTVARSSRSVSSRSALAIGLGEVNDIFGERDHVVRTLIVLVGCVGATLLTCVRERREPSSTGTRPAVARRAAARARARSRRDGHVALGPAHRPGRVGRATRSAVRTRAGDVRRPVRHLRVVPAPRGSGTRPRRGAHGHGRMARRGASITASSGPTERRTGSKGRGEPVRDASRCDRRRRPASRSTSTRGTGRMPSAPSSSTRERGARQLAERSTRAAAAAQRADARAFGCRHRRRGRGHDRAPRAAGPRRRLRLVRFARRHERATLVTRAHEGYPAGRHRARTSRSPLDDARLPATEVLRTGRADLRGVARGPRRSGIPQYCGTAEMHGSFAVVPVAAIEDTPGVLSFGFLEDRDVRRRRSPVHRGGRGSVRAGVAPRRRCSKPNNGAGRACARCSTSPSSSPVSTIRKRCSHTTVRVRGDAHRSLRDRARARARRHAAPGRDRARRQPLQPARSRSSSIADVDAPRSDREGRRHRARRRPSAAHRRPAPHRSSERRFDDDVRALLERLGPVSGIVVAMQLSGRTRGVVAHRRRSSGPVRPRRPRARHRPRPPRAPRRSNARNCGS